MLRMYVTLCFYVIYVGGYFKCVCMLRYDMYVRALCYVCIMCMCAFNVCARCVLCRVCKRVMYASMYASCVLLCTCVCYLRMSGLYVFMLCVYVTYAC